MFVSDCNGEEAAVIFVSHHSKLLFIMLKEEKKISHISKSHNILSKDSMIRPGSPSYWMTDRIWIKRNKTIKNTAEAL